MESTIQNRQAQIEFSTFSLCLDHPSLQRTAKKQKEAKTKQTLPKNIKHSGNTNFDEIVKLTNRCGTDL